MPIQTVVLWAKPVSVDDERRLVRVIILGNRYYTRLAEIENRYRADVRALSTQFENTSELIDRLRAMSPADRDGSPGNDVRRELDALRRRRRVDPEYQATSKQMSTQMFEAKKQARHESGLAPGAWGTYQWIEDHHEQAARTTHWSSDVKPHRPISEGGIAVHAQGKPVTSEDLLGGGWGFAQLDRERYALGRQRDGYAERSTGTGDWGPSSSIDRPPARRMQEMRMRVDSNGRMPVWARLHCLALDRIPAGRILWVRAHQKRIGTKFRWSVQIVVDAVDPFHAPPPVAEVVGVDLRCGRPVEGGRLLAHAIGSDGERFSLILPEVRVVRRGARTRSVGCFDQNGKADSLRSIRDRAMNQVARQIHDFGRSLPDGHSIREETQHTALWRRWTRVIHFTRRFDDAIRIAEGQPPSAASTSLAGRIPHPAPPSATPIPAADPIPADPIPDDRIGEAKALLITLNAAIKQDRHLFDWQKFQEQKMDRRIRGRVEQWCAMLANRYGVVAFEDLSIRDLKEQPGWLGDVVAQRIQTIAPGRLREAAERSARKRGRTFMRVETKNSTRACAGCGELRDGDLSADRVTCERCGRSDLTWDTAAQNILARAVTGLREARLEALAPTSATGKPEVKRHRRNRRILRPEVAEAPTPSIE